VPYTHGSQPAIVPDVGEGDAEHRSAKKSAGVRLQQSLLERVDSHRVHRVLSTLASSAATRDRERHRHLADLSNANTEHEWLWAINPAHGFVLPPESFVTAVRLRLGLPVASYVGARKCRECGKTVTAAELGSHALLCGRGQRTIGHNQIRDHLAALARAVDPTTQTEVAFGSSLSSSASSSSASPSVDRLRPADVLTSAAPFGGVGRVALDIGITSPHIVAACNRVALDPLDEYRAVKSRQYTAPCHAAGWGYMPLTLSSLGRAHAETRSAVHKLAVAASKSFGGSDPSRTEATWWRNATTLLMERNARMVARCVPDDATPPIISGVDEHKWGHVPHPRAKREVPARAESLVTGGVPGRHPSGD